HGKASQAAAAPDAAVAGPIAREGDVAQRDLPLVEDRASVSARAAPAAVVRDEDEEVPRPARPAVAAVAGLAVHDLDVVEDEHAVVGDRAPVRAAGAVPGRAQLVGAAPVRAVRSVAPREREVVDLEP